MTTAEDAPGSKPASGASQAAHAEAERASPEAAAKVTQLLTGVRLSQSISVAASLGVADVLASGARPVKEIADAIGADEPTLYRLLRALAAAGLFREEADRAFSLTELGTTLRKDIAGSIRDQAILFGRPYMLASWGNVEHSIRTGQNAFTAQHGEDIWSWRAREPAEASVFNRGMASMSAPVGPALATALNPSGISTIADIGGGSGTLLAAVLAAHPSLRGIVFDQPAVVAEARPVLEAAGVIDRAALIGGSFFEQVPVADVYVMKSIIHDWADEESIAILRTILSAAPATARLLLVERILGGPNEDLAGKLSDLHMLVMPGGQERTQDEWRDLLHRAGWSLVGARPLVGIWHLIEAVPA